MSKGDLVKKDEKLSKKDMVSKLGNDNKPPYYQDVFNHVLLVIPTLDEEKTIGSLLDKVLEYLPKYQVIVVDGNSQDKTIEEATKRGVPCIKQKSKGKGGALIEAMENLDRTKFEIIVFIDGDLTYHIEDLEELVKPVFNQEYDMVIGDRLRGDREDGAITTMNMIGNWTFSVLIKILFGGTLTDTQTGYRALSLKAIDTILPYLTSESFEIETEMNILAERKQLDVKTVPIKYTNRPDGSETKLDPIKVGWRILKKIVSMRFKSLD